MCVRLNGRRFRRNRRQSPPHPGSPPTPETPSAAQTQPKRLAISFQLSARLRCPSELFTPTGWHTIAQGRNAGAHPGFMGRARTNPGWQRREGYLSDHVRKVANTFPAPSPPRSTCLLPCAFCGGEGGVRGPHRSLRPPHPGPLPHSRVLPESRIDGGGEGAEPWETPGGSPSRRCLKGFYIAPDHARTGVQPLQGRSLRVGLSQGALLRRDPGL